MGAESYLANLINTSTQKVLDFGGAVYKIDAAITLTTANTVWREIRNLNLEVDADTDFVAINFPRWSGAIETRSIQNLHITKASGSGILTGCSTMPTNLNWINCRFDACDIGMVSYAANLNSFFGCLWTDCGTGLQLRADTINYPSGGGGVGNDNRFFGCSWRNNTTYGVHLVKADNETGGSGGNNCHFYGCTFEGSSTTHLKIENGYYHTINGCRFESVNATAATNEYAIIMTEESVSGATAAVQGVRITDCTFSLGLTGGGGATMTGIYVGSGCADIKLLNNDFSTSGSATQLSINNDSTTLMFNRNAGAGDYRVYGRIYMPPTTAPASAGAVSSAGYTALAWNTMSLDNANEFDQPSNGQLRFTGERGGTFRVQASLHILHDAAGELRIRFNKYDSSGASSAGVTKSAREIIVAAGEVGFTKSIELCDFMTLDQNDYVTIEESRTAGTGNSTIYAGWIMAERISE